MSDFFPVTPETLRRDAASCRDEADIHAGRAERILEASRTLASVTLAGLSDFADLLGVDDLRWFTRRTNYGRTVHVYGAGAWMESAECAPDALAELVRTIGDWNRREALRLRLDAIAMGEEAESMSIQHCMNP